VGTGRSEAGALEGGRGREMGPGRLEEEVEGKVAGNPSCWNDLLPSQVVDQVDDSGGTDGPQGDSQDVFN